MISRIHTAEEMAELVQEIGFMPLFENGISGFSVEEHTPARLWFSETEDGPWEWKGPVIQNKNCTYGKFFQGKMGFVSMQWFPEYANVCRGGLDFGEQYEEGMIPNTDRLIYDMIREDGPQLTRDLKRKGGFGKDGKKGFDGSLARLQQKTYVVISNFEYALDRQGVPYGWGMARYDIPEHRFGSDFEDRVYKNLPEESENMIMDHLLKKMPHAQEEQLQKILFRKLK